MFNHGGPQPLQYAAASAFLAALYADYQAAINVPGWTCGPTFFRSEYLRAFARSQVGLIQVLFFLDSKQSDVVIS